MSEECSLENPTKTPWRLRGAHFGILTSVAFRCSLLEGVYEISSWTMMHSMYAQSCATSYGKRYRVLSSVLWGLVYKHKSSTGSTQIYHTYSDSLHSHIFVVLFSSWTLLDIIQTDPPAFVLREGQGPMSGTLSSERCCLHATLPGCQLIVLEVASDLTRSKHFLASLPMRQSSELLRRQARRKCHNS